MSDPVERTLELDDDPEFSRRAWHVQVVGRWLLVLALVGAMAGLVGHGPLSWTSADAADGRLGVAYERYGRRGGSQTIELHLAGELASDGRWTIMISGAVAGKHELTTITPEPTSMRASADGLELSFEQVGRADLAVVISLTPGGLWGETSRVIVPGEAEIVLHQFIYP